MLAGGDTGQPLAGLVRAEDPGPEPSTHFGRQRGLPGTRQTTDEHEPRLGAGKRGLDVEHALQVGRVEIGDARGEENARVVDDDVHLARDRAGQLGHAAQV